MENEKQTRNQQIRGYVVDRINGYKIVEGVAQSGGLWAAKGHGESVVYNTRREAEDHAEAFYA